MRYIFQIICSKLPPTTTPQRYPSLLSPTPAPRLIFTFFPRQSEPPYGIEHVLLSGLFLHLLLHHHPPLVRVHRPPHVGERRPHIDRRLRWHAELGRPSDHPHSVLHLHPSPTHLLVLLHPSHPSHPIISPPAQSRVGLQQPSRPPERVLLRLLRLSIVLLPL